MIEWNNYFIGLNRIKGINLFIGNGVLNKDGSVKFNSKSGDRTFEIVNAVGKYMALKMKANKNNKKYFGYDIPGCGKLILIKPGYKFFIRKEYNPEQE